jgi:hypothetical protein
MASLDSDDDRRQWQLPLMLAVALLLVAGSRFAPSFTASVFALGFPLLAVTLAFARLKDSVTALRNVGLALGGVALIASELRIWTAFELAPAELRPLADSDGSVWLLVAAAVAAAAVQAAAARRGMRTFAGAWVGMTAALAIYLPGHFAPTKERFGQVIAALLVAMVAGGGPGLLTGALLSSLVKPRSGVSD